MDQPSFMGVMQASATVATSSAESRKEDEPSDPDREIAAFDELGHDEAESVFRAAHVEDGHDVGMVQPGEDSGFNKKRFHILGVSDSFRVWHLDGDRTVEVVVVSQIDPSEPALTEPTDDPVAPILEGSPCEDSLELAFGDCEPSVPAWLKVSSEVAFGTAASD